MRGLRRSTRRLRRRCGRVLRRPCGPAGSRAATGRVRCRLRPRRPRSGRGQSASGRIDQCPATCSAVRATSSPRSGRGGPPDQACRCGGLRRGGCRDHAGLRRTRAHSDRGRRMVAPRRCDQPAPAGGRRTPAARARPRRRTRRRGRAGRRRLSGTVGLPLHLTDPGPAEPRTHRSPSAGHRRHGGCGRDGRAQPWPTARGHRPNRFTPSPKAWPRSHRSRSNGCVEQNRRPTPAAEVWGSRQVQR